MKYKMGRISGELGAARKVFINRSIGANTLMEDFNRMAQGLAPLNINKQFNNYQKNRYRIWSEAYKDIQALRTMNYTELEIRDMIKGRRAFSTDEVNRLMLGRYMPANVPEISFMNQNGFSAQIKQINREKRTQYLPQEFYSITDLNDIKFKWMNAELGQGLNEIEEALGVPLEIRGQELEEDLGPYEDLINAQTAEDERRIEEEQKLREERSKKFEDQSKAPIPLNAPPVDTEIFTASRVSPTISGTVDQNTGLTGTESAVLSPLEQQIAKKRNQGIGSLT
jgi:hypothetical protein